MTAYPPASRRALSAGLLCLTVAALLPPADSRADEPSRPLSFVNDVVPVLTKAGCNMGVCHAKAGTGQNGFQLSLFGFEPHEDYEFLTREARGRRLNPAAPDDSLLLKKAAARTPHGGGVRLTPDSHGYTVLREWIRQGAPWGSDDPQFTGLEVRPPAGQMQPGDQQQLQAIARYSDGSERDVTVLAVFESNDPAMAEVTSAGLVTASDIPGKVAVMVRYQSQVGVYTAAVPLGAPVANVPPSKNFIDDFVFGNLKELGIPPSDICDDATFLRRVSIDIAGRLPTEEEARAFLESDAPDKRDRLVEDLLRTSDYADYFAGKWAALLKNRRDNAGDITSNFAFHAWIRDSLLENKPYDQLVRELLAATGDVLGNPPVAWYNRVKEPKEQIEDVAQLFLGVRVQCAQCHHHPFERWSQDDYYGLVAFFSRVGRKPTSTRGEDLVFHDLGIATAKNARTGKELRPSALGNVFDDIPADRDPRLKLADWMAAPDNPFFAKALVNRYWKHFFKRALVEPEDDIRDSNPATNPELLAALEKHFVESGFDLKELVRLIAQSHAYQLSSEPNEYNLADRQNYSRFYPRRLQAEVLHDAIDQLTGAQSNFANLPPGTRAIALPDNSYNRASPFLRVFGRPEAESVCECERVQSSSLAQTLHLINSAEIKNRLATAGGRAQSLANDQRSAEEKVRALYLAAFAREPREDELQTVLAWLAEPLVDAAGNPLDEKQAAREQYQDLLWALMNTKEFLFNH